MTFTADVDQVEDLERFRERARTWIRANLEHVGERLLHDLLRGMHNDEEELAQVESDRRLQRMLFDAGLAGICIPTAYGGQGLTPAHQRALNEELVGYEYPSRFQSPTMSPCVAVILEFGTEQQKRTYLPRMFDGTDLWIQFLSEPTGGSDLASAITRADRDGDEWVVNGSKIWTSTADKADMGMCLVRTNWDVPKHRGMSVLVIPMDAPGLEIHPLRLVSGQTGFCQEFFTDVRVPADALLGELNDGWNVASRLLVHERNVLNGGSEYFASPGGGFAAMMAGGATRRDDLVDLADARGRSKDPHVRQLVAEAYANAKVGGQTGPRVTSMMAKGLVPPAASSILKLINSENSIRRSDISMAIAGTPAVAWEEDDTRGQMRGVGYLSRQTASLVSGTSEIQRNIISERVLDLPREASPDRELPFSEVRHNTMPTGR